ncbi:MAG TPA: hypothetical protein VMU99_10815 [Acidimicrobiales bacterium]|nr:hypothetical protein [Acidimicrobiales bacterium]
MGLFDALLGKSKVAQPDLGHLFALSSAAVSLQATENLISTLRAGVCFKSLDAQSFSAARSEITGLLTLEDGSNAAATADSGVTLRETTDRYNYNWMVLNGTDFDTLVTRTHFVNSTLDDHGFGPLLLCSVFGFRPLDAKKDGAASTYLVYLFKQGTFYPFVPQAGERRNNEIELRIKNELGNELPIEPQLDRWFPMWDLPL